MPSHGPRPAAALYLTVGITVALAAVAFAFAQSLVQSPEPPPRMVARWDGREEAVVVQQAPPETRWSDLDVACSDGSAPFLLDGTGEAIDPTRPVQGGDAVAGCGPGATLTISHSESGAVLSRSEVPE